MYKKTPYNSIIPANLF